MLSRTCLRTRWRLNDNLCTVARLTCVPICMLTSTSPRAITAITLQDHQRWAPTDFSGCITLRLWWRIALMRETSANTARNTEGGDHHLMRLEVAKEHSTFLGDPCSKHQVWTELRCAFEELQSSKTYKQSFVWSHFTPLLLILCAMLVVVVVSVRNNDLVFFVCLFSAYFLTKMINFNVKFTTRMLRMRKQSVAGLLFFFQRPVEEAIRPEKLQDALRIVWSRHIHHFRHQEE